MDNYTHKYGPLITKYGSLYSLNGCMIENPAIIINVPEEDDDIVTLLKYGSSDNIRKKYTDMCNSYKNNGFQEFMDDLKIMEFNTLTSFSEYDKITGANFTTDEICTLINWLNNHISVKSFKELFSSEENMHKTLSELATLGF